MKTEIQYVKATSIAQITILLLCRELEGKEGFRMTNKQIAAEINRLRVEAGDVKAATKGTSPECVAWYASKLRDETFAAKHGVVNYKPLMAYKTDKSQ